MQNRQTVPAPKRRNATKGARTRAILKQVARKLFEVDGHAGVTAQSIVEAAGISSGTFYIYFSNKNEIISEICRDFIDKMINSLAVERSYDSEYEYICIGHHIYVKYVNDNWRFYRFLISYSFVNSDILEILHNARIREAERTAAFLHIMWNKAGREPPEKDAKGAIKMAMALHAMTEGVMQDELNSLAPGSELTAAKLRDLALYMGRLFYRSVFLEEPPVIQFDR